jgi:hypothetical protein
MLSRKRPLTVPLLAAVLALGLSANPVLAQSGKKQQTG